MILKWWKPRSPYWWPIIGFNRFRKMEWTYGSRFKLCDKTNQIKLNQIYSGSDSDFQLFLEVNSAKSNSNCILSSTFLSNMPTILKSKSKDFITTRLAQWRNKRNNYIQLIPIYCRVLLQEPTAWRHHFNALKLWIWFSQNWYQY